MQKNGLLEEKYLTRNGVPTWIVKGEKVDYQNAQKLSDKAQKLVDFLVGSWGNHEVILKFLMLHQDNLSRAIDLLSTLSAKDLRDMQMDILEDHFNAHSNQLSPRVEDEMIIHPFKQFFEEQFEKMKTSVADDRDVSSKSVKANNAAKAKQSLAQVFRQDPARLVEWVKENIRLNPDKKALQIAQTPMGVWTSRLTDERSRKIFFVDVARSLGIEARVDAVTKKLQYKQGGVKEGLQNDVWIDVDFDAKA